MAIHPVFADVVQSGPGVDRPTNIPCTGYKKNKNKKLSHNVGTNSFLNQKLSIFLVSSFCDTNVDRFQQAFVYYLCLLRFAVVYILNIHSMFLRLLGAVKWSEMCHSFNQRPLDKL